MSLLHSRLSKLRGSHALVMRRSSCLLLQSNDFSSSLPQKQTPPCQIIGLEFGGVAKKPIMGRLVIKNANDEAGTFVEVEKKVPPEVVYNDCLEFKMVTIGASHGWVATVKDNDPGILRLQDDLIPVATKLPPKRIPLPPLVTLRHCQTQIVTNVSMTSSSPEEDEDCVVAVKFLGPQLSFCKPGIRNKAEWSNVKIENPSFYSSRIMYSKKDGMFHIPGCGGHVIGSLDPRDEKPIIKIQQLRFENLLELNKATRDLLDSCFTSQHLVESPSTGETFMVKQYKKTTDGVTKKGVVIMKTEFVMVFKLEDDGNKAVYTQDIGDLVIFISKNEPFCVPASSFPGLISNRVHVMDYGEIVYLILGLDDQPHILSDSTESMVPYYIPPQNIDEAHI